MAANCMGEVCLGPNTPAKRVQLTPKFVYSRRRFREKKFILPSLPHRQDGLFSPSTSDPPTSDVASSPELAPPATPHPPTDYHRPAHGQSELKKREEANTNKSCMENVINGVNTETKKRKNDGIDLNKRPLQTPKQKIYRPKVVGEVKPKRPREPKTPKPKTPKRAYTKKSSKRVGVRRGLNFDDVSEEKLSGDRSIVVVVRDLVVDLKPLSVTKRKRSKQRKRTSSFVKSGDLQGCEAKTNDAGSDQNPIPCNFKSIGYSEETLKICNTVKPDLIDINLPYVENENEKSVAGQSTEKNDNGTIVPHVTVADEQAQQGQLCVVKKSRKELMLEVYKDEIKAWKQEAKRIGYGNADGEASEEKLKSERATFRDRIRVFTSCMHIILGDRTFSKWKGSVIDSVIGVFLTQNVSDILSSSAFIDLRARFPVKSSSSCDEGFKLLDIEDFVPNSCQEDSACSDSCLTDEQKLEEVMKMMDTLMRDGKRKSLSSTSTESLFSEKKKSTVKEVDNEEKIDWEEVRKRYQRHEKRSNKHKDSVDWEAVRQAPVDELADTIKKRGQHNNIAKRIKAFLDRVVELHKTLDLEWLRHVPADLVQKYLLEFNGLGLKSVECIRLLGIQNVAFPVDTNVGRIAIRLGWVPLEPLPEEVQIHLLQQYPMMDSIQKYLWPRLCTLDQRQLYELHYHLITFGKVFCTKRNPNCNECPMKAECRHYASHYASARKSLPAATPRNKNQSSSSVEVFIHSLPPPPPLEIEHFEPTTHFEPKTCEPVIEMPQSPEPERGELVDREVEEHYFFEEDDDETIPTIRLNEEEPRLSCAMVPLAPEVGSYPIPKLKSVSRLRTKHLVYELPDSHHILAGLDQREVNDRCPYLLAIWTSDETASSSQPSGNPCCTVELGKTTCNKETCSSCTGFREHNQNTIRGTILIPCRTAMRGSFPLNGTYFQVNEVFADHESSHNPIDVPTRSLWNLRQRITYFGTSTTSIFKGLTNDEITINFWTGFMCNRAFDRKTGITKPLALRLHMSVAHQQAGTRKKKQKKNGVID